MRDQTIAIKIFLSLLEKCGDLQALSPSETIKSLWNCYEKEFPSNNNVNGKVFEEIIGYILAREGCIPFYMQAQVAYVPNVNYDFILYDNEFGPIALSAKTSLRERWKQADLEAVALKYVHRNASSYAITLHEREAATRVSKLKDSMAINDFILATSSKFDALINEMKKRKFELAGTIQIVTSNTIIDKVASKTRYGL